MNREQFFAKLAPLGEQQVKQALWNVYWRGTAAVRERIEAELEPAPAGRPHRVAAEPVDPESVLAEVRAFVSLARSGAYIAGNRSVSPKERTQWRSTFKRLLADARAALRDDEDFTPGAAAMEALIDLAREIRDYDYFRSQDPVEAARLVVSDEVTLLWGRLLERRGFRAFAEQAAPQLIRWETGYGWTRSGWGKIAEKETSLTSVLTSMLRAADEWKTFADSYLDALDRVAAGGVPRHDSWRSADYARSQRTDALAEWHGLLLQKLADDELEDRIERLTSHRALGGPELTFLQARAAILRGDEERARSLVHDSLTKLPGHQGFIAFAIEIGAPLPPRSDEIVKEAARVSAMLES